MRLPPPERWRRIEPILDGALDLPPAERRPFLDRACAGDERLREDVEELLAACTAAGPRWERPAGGFARPLLEDVLRRFEGGGSSSVSASSGGALEEEIDDWLGEEFEEGQVLGPYRIVRRLGRGGMGVVYLAHDDRLDRPVALKRLPEHRALRPSAREALLREAKSASALDHPNIATIYEVADDPLGSPYIAMAYYAGDTLKDRLAQGPLRLEEVSRVGAQIACGLEAAHARGIVHRDIKPGNVILTPDGLAKILDFGIAKPVGARPEGAGRVGTVAYMSPEHIRGDELGGRSDVWSLGVVLFEMLAGRRPFDAASTGELVHRIRDDEPPALDALRDDLPPELVTLVARCLEKDPGRRPTAAKLSAGLRSLTRVHGDATRRSRRRAIAARGHRRLRPGLAGALALIAALGAAAMLLPGGGDDAAAAFASGERHPVVVADVESPTGDSLLALAVADLLRVSLGQSPAIKPIDDRTIAGALARMGREAESRLDPALAREVALRAHVPTVVAGGLNRLGSSYALDVRVLSAETGEELASLLESSADSAGLIAAVDRLARRLRVEIGESSADIHNSRPLEQVTTRSLDALEKYSLALHVRRSDRPRAISLLREAVALDTGFAMALRWLGTQAQSGSALARAYSHRHRVEDRERYIIEGTYHQFVTGDSDAAISAFRNLLDLDPDDWLGLWNLGVEYLILRDHARAEATFQRAIHAQRDLTVSSYLGAAAAQLALGESEEARHTMEAAKEHFPDDHAWRLVRWASAQRRYRDVLDGRWWTESRSPAFPDHRASLAAVFGQLDEATGRLEAAMAADRTTGVRPLLRLREAAAVISMLRSQVARDPVGALSVLERVLGEDRLEPGPLTPVHLLHVARAFALAGDAARARELVTAYDSAVGRDALLTRAGQIARGDVLADIAFAEGRYDAAVEGYRAADVGQCTICALPLLGRALERAGASDTAIATYERYLETPYYYRLESDRFYLADVLERLARLYEERGEHRTAAGRYRELVELWSDADAVLEPRVEAARRRLADLPERQ